MVLCIFTWIAAPAALAGPSMAEYEGQGQATIVGGNQVSARRLALRQARRDAVSAAATALLPVERGEELEARLRSEVYARATVYVRTYRVLEERQEARRFHVKVAARVNLSRLQEDLNRIVGAKPGAPGSAPPARVSLAFDFDGSWPEQRRSAARASLLEAFRARGLRVQTQPATGAMILTVGLASSDGPAIRGTGWPTVKVAMTLRLAGGGERLADTRASAWGAARSGGAARADALARCISRGLAGLMRTDRARAALASLRPGWLEVRITGVASARQVRQLRQQVCGGSAPGVSRCLLGQAGRGEALFSLRSGRSAAALAAALAQRQLGPEHTLKIHRVEGGQVWLTIEKVPQPPEEGEAGAETPPAG